MLQYAASSAEKTPTFVQEIQKPCAACAAQGFFNLNIPVMN